MTNSEMEKQLWDVANQLRANSKLKSSEYSLPVLGLIFLRHAEYKFANTKDKFEKAAKGSRKQIGKNDYHAEGVLYLPDQARYSYLLNLPEGEDIGFHIDAAMDAIENDNSQLGKGTLPRGYTKFDNDMLVALLKAFSKIAFDVNGDIFGKIYEYFLGKFAMTEGQKGGEFFTPTSLVKLIVEIIEPFHGKILDPACGSGGMFVQSAHFVERNKKNPSNELMIYGQEKTGETVNLCKINLAVHGLEGDIKEGNTFYEDIHDSVGKFDFVMANPPFNVSGVDYEKVKGDKRWSIGLPSTDNANYLWIQLFWTALNKKGRAGFVMANSASDARGKEADIRKSLIEKNVVDVMVAISGNFFYTVTLPCSLWFLDNNKGSRKDILFIDARQFFVQIDRAHKEFSATQIEFISNIVRLYRGEKVLNEQDSASLLKQYFPKGKYGDVQGLCKVASLKEIEEQGYSLNPGRYVGITEVAEEDYNFLDKLEEYNEELEKLNEESRLLEQQIAKNVQQLLGQKE